MAEGFEKVTADQVEGLPEGACLQHNLKAQITYVYFGYNFRKPDGSKVVEKDYIGTVKFRKFVPNAYYLTEHPVRSKRPVENWKDPIQKARAMARAAEEKSLLESREEAKLDLPEDQEVHLGAGATLIGTRILYESGLVEDVAEVLDYDIKTTMDVLNLALHAALTAKPTYLAAAESDIQKFIGTGCISSQRASELFVRIGSRLNLSKDFGRLRARRLAQDGDLLALDGTRIDCNSRKISAAAIGKKKNGTTGPQINFSLACNTTSGYPICYRWYAGNINDSSTMDDFRALFVEFGLNDRKITTASDRGYYVSEELARWCKEKLSFIVGVKTNVKIVRDVIDEKNAEFYRPSNLLNNHFCYGFQVKNILGKGTEKAPVDTYIYFSPNKQMIETRALREELKDFEEKWITGQAASDDKRLIYFKNPKAGRQLELNKEAFDNECYMRGFFACVANVNDSLDGLLSKYRLRNEVEVLFRLMLGNLYRTTRVQSTAAMEGQIFVVFIALTILAKLRQDLRTRVPAKQTVQAANADLIETDDEMGILNDWMTRSELIKRFQRIMLVRDKSGLRLLSATKGDQELIAKLGYAGLFDTARGAWDLLSARRLAETIRAAQARKSGGE